MAITVSCNCGKQFKVKDHLAGRAMRCPNCKSPLRIPGVKATASAGVRPSGGSSSKVDAEAAILKVEEAQKKRQMTAEAEAAYRAEQNKLIESYDQLAGKSKPTKEGEKPEKKKTELAGSSPKKVTIFTKIADAFAAVFGTLLAKYIIVALFLGAGAVGSVYLVKFMTGYMHQETAPIKPKEQRIKELMEEAEKSITARKWTDAKSALDELLRLDPKLEMMNRDYKALRKKLDEGMAGG